MPSLLARFAASIFWMARYIERAESLARIIDINETYARDNPDGPDWNRVLDLYADTARFREIHGGIDPGEKLGQRIEFFTDVAQLTKDSISERLL